MLISSTVLVRCGRQGPSQPPQEGAAAHVGAAHAFARGSAGAGSLSTHEGLGSSA